MSENDLGFFTESDHLSAASEPRATSVVNRASLTTTIIPGCTRCGTREVVWRYCYDHGKWEWLEKVGAGGDHVLVGRAQRSPTGAITQKGGDYMEHECE